MTLPEGIAGAIMTDARLWDEFCAVCDCGGRVAGSASELAAQSLLTGLGAAAIGVPANLVPTAYDGWTCHGAAVELVHGRRRTPLACAPLLRSRAGTMEAEVLPLGRGTEAEFDAAGDRLLGRIALVRHEYMFAAGHIHRRQKFSWTQARGAAGFLIAGPLPCAAVAGGAGPELVALGISPEAAWRLSQDGARATLHVDATHAPATTDALLFDLPGRGAERVVLSAHLDGHAPGESAMDNASGVAAALAAARALAPHIAAAPRGLTLAFFSAEEWALTGSRVWLDSLSEDTRRAIVLNVNLDSVAGGRTLTALTSGFPALANFVRAGLVPVGVHEPLAQNSDHANFATHGIPALRLVAGFDDPASNLRHVLTAADTRDKVTLSELRLAALCAADLAWRAVTDPSRWE